MLNDVKASKNSVKTKCQPLLYKLTLSWSYISQPYINFLINNHKFWNRNLYSTIIRTPDAPTRSCREDNDWNYSTRSYRNIYMAFNVKCKRTRIQCSTVKELRDLKMILKSGYFHRKQNESHRNWAMAASSTTNHHETHLHVVIYAIVHNLTRI